MAPRGSRGLARRAGTLTFVTKAPRSLWGGCHQSRPFGARPRRTVRPESESLAVRRSAISAALVLGAVVADGEHARAVTLYLALAAGPAGALPPLSLLA